MCRIMTGVLGKGLLTGGTKVKKAGMIMSDSGDSSNMLKMEN